MKKLFFTGALFLIIFSFPQTTFAAEIIHNFDVSITAHQNGDMTVVEKIEYDFDADNRHGVFRFIPTYTKLKDADLYRISEINFTDVKRDGNDEPYTTDYGLDEVEV